MAFQKNVTGQKWRVFAFNTTTGAAVTGDSANISAKISQDWGTNTALGDAAPIEDEDGYYTFDLTQAETNGDVLDLYPESSTANVQVVGVPGTIFTQPANFSDLGIASDGDISGNVDGNVVGSVASVTGAVGSVTGAVASVTGAVGSVTGNVGGSVASVTGAVGSVTGAVGSVTAGVTVTTNNDKTGYSLTADFRLKKNTAFSNFSFPMFDSADHVTLKTGETVTGTRSINGAAFGSLANSVTEITGTGIYKVNLDAPDLNGDMVVLKFTSTNTDDTVFMIVLQTE